MLRSWEERLQAPHHANLAAGLSHRSPPHSSLNNITFSHSLFLQPHLTFTSPNLPVKAYLHAHVILTTTRQPGLLFFLEFVSCRTNLCDLELPLVSANLELLPR